MEDLGRVSRDLDVCPPPSVDDQIVFLNSEYDLCMFFTLRSRLSEKTIPECPRLWRYTNKLIVLGARQRNTHYSSWTWFVSLYSHLGACLGSFRIHRFGHFGGFWIFCWAPFVFCDWYSVYPEIKKTLMLGILSEKIELSCSEFFQKKLNSHARNSFKQCGVNVPVFTGPDSPEVVILFVMFGDSFIFMVWILSNNVE